MPNDSIRENYIRMIEGNQLLDGRFSEIERIDPSGGGGQFSLVFRALDNGSNRRVALKFYNFSDPSNNDAYRIASFEREVDVLTRLNGRRDIIGMVSPISQYSELLSTSTGLSFPVPFWYYVLELAEYNVRDAIMKDMWIPIQK